MHIPPTSALSATPMTLTPATVAPSATETTALPAPHDPPPRAPAPGQQEAAVRTHLTAADRALVRALTGQEASLSGVVENGTVTLPVPPFVIKLATDRWMAASGPRPAGAGAAQPAADVRL